MKIGIALAGALLLTVAPVTAQEAAPAATVDQSRLSPNMQSFMSKVDAMRARRQAREGENSSRVLPPGDPVDSKGWHKAQGHKRVNWSGASGYSPRRRRAKKASADAGAAKAEKTEAKAEKKEEKKEEKKGK